MQLRIQFYVLLAFSLQLVGPRYCLAEFESYSAFEGETPGPSFEQQAALDPSLVENQIVTMKPIGSARNSDSEFKPFGLSWVKQSALMGGKVGYAWPMPVENTSLGLAGSYLTDRRREQRIGVGIESISYLGEELQTGWFLKGGLGLFANLRNKPVLEKSIPTGQEPIQNKGNLTKSTKRKPSNESSNEKIRLIPEIGTGHTLKIFREYLIHFSLSAGFEKNNGKTATIVIMDIGFIW